MMINNMFSIETNKLPTDKEIKAFTTKLIEADLVKHIEKRVDTDSCSENIFFYDIVSEFDITECVLYIAVYRNYITVTPHQKNDSEIAKLKETLNILLEEM